MPLSRSQVYVVQLALLFLASYVLPLQAYVFQQPEAGANNFHQYSNMYLAPFDMGATYAPFIFRQFGATLVHLVYAAGIFVDLDIRFQATEEVRRVFFAAIVVNWAGLFLACALVTDIVNRITGFRRPVIGLLSGLLILVSYGTSVYAVTGLMDAWTWTFVAALFWCMQTRRDVLFFALLALSVTQREVTPLIFAVWSAVDLVRLRGDRTETRRALFRAVAGFGLFAAYLALRFFVFPDVPGNEHQLSPEFWAGQLTNPAIGAGLLFKVLVQQNILILLAVLACCTVLLRNARDALHPVVRAGGLNLAIVLLMLTVLGLGAGIWLNTARLLLFMSPVIAVYAALLAGDLLAGEGANGPER